MWQISKLTTRLAGGIYSVLNRYGKFAYVVDDFGNMVPANGLTQLIG